MTRRPHVAVIGGGVTGLAAARKLSRARIGGVQPQVTVLERSGRVGGKIRSRSFAGATVDVGPEALFAAAPEAARLCRELGLGDELVPTMRSNTAVWSRGRLREMPAGILGGLPDGIGPVLRSGILSPAGAARAGADLLLPRDGGGQDESVGSLVRRRLGDQALERMIDPLLGGIYGGDPDALSLRATAPRLHALANEHRSLIRGLIAAGRSAPRAQGPMLVTLPGGLQRLVTRLRADLGETEVVEREGVVRIDRLPDGRHLLHTSTGRELVVDATLVAAPADAAAQMLRASVPAAAAELAEISYTSVTVLWLAFPAKAFRQPPDTTGFLVPRGERRMLTACTLASAKWPHLAAHSDRVFLRCSVGRNDPQAATLDDETLVRRVVAELGEAVQAAGEPLEAQVTRWPDAMPQYTVGHLDRIARLDEALTPLPRLKLAGAAYRGVGVPQCIAQGEAAADQIVSALS